MEIYHNDSIDFKEILYLSVCLQPSRTKTDALSRERGGGEQVVTITMGLGRLRCVSLSQSPSRDIYKS